jgi:hypothetical protein
MQFKKCLIFLSEVYFLHPSRHYRPFYFWIQGEDLLMRVQERHSGPKKSRPRIISCSNKEHFFATKLAYSPLLIQCTI